MGGAASRSRQVDGIRLHESGAPQTVAEVTESPIPTTVADPAAMVIVGVAAAVVVAKAFGAGSWGNPLVPVEVTAPRMAQTAAVKSRAPTASRAGVGRRGL